MSDIEDLSHIPTTWAFTIERVTGDEESRVTVWVEANDQLAAETLFNRSCPISGTVISIVEYQPASIQAHQDWWNGNEGNLAAIIQEQ